MQRNDGKVLKFRWLGGYPYAQWENLATQSSPDTLYSTGTVSITGNPVILNGLPINFSSSIGTPVTIGGMPAWFNF
jgi:hypothetical protein